MHLTTWPTQCQNSTALLKSAHPIQCAAQTRPWANMLQLNSMIEIGRGTQIHWKFSWFHCKCHFQGWNFANYSKWGISISCCKVGTSVIVYEDWRSLWWIPIKKNRLTGYILGMLTRAARPCLTSLSWDIWLQNLELSPVKLCQQPWLGCVHFRVIGHLRIITGSTQGMYFDMANI